jgi:hypothetical protein
MQFSLLSIEVVVVLSHKHSFSLNARSDIYTSNCLSNKSYMIIGRESHLCYTSDETSSIFIISLHECVLQTTFNSTKILNFNEFNELLYT